VGLLERKLENILKGSLRFVGLKDKGNTGSQDMRQDKWGERRKRRWKIGEAGHATHTQ